jgi:hypothetical protein
VRRVGRHGKVIKLSSLYIHIKQCSAASAVYSFLSGFLSLVLDLVDAFIY